MEYFIQRLSVSSTEEHGPFGDNTDFVYSSKYCPLGGNKHLLCMTNEGGYLALDDTSINLQKKPLDRRRRCLKAHANAVFDSVWLDKPSSIVTVSGDQTARLFDVNVCEESKPVSVFVQHSRSVKTVDAEPTRRVVFATGSRDGSICLWDSRVARNGVIAKPENRIVNAHACSENRLKRAKCGGPQTDGNASSSVTAVVYQDEFRLISSASGDGYINIWDLRRNYSAYTSTPLPCEQLPYPGKSVRKGYTSLTLNSSCTRLFSNCTDGTLYEWNVASYQTEPEHRYTGHMVSGFHVKADLSPDGQFLVSGSSDNYAYIWSTRSGDSQPICKLDGHGAEVTAVAWSKNDDLSLVTCSDDYHSRIWRYDPLSTLEDYKPQFRCHSELVSTPKACNILKLSVGLNIKFYKPLPLKKVIFASPSKIARKRKLPAEPEMNKRILLSAYPESPASKASKRDLPLGSTWVALRSPAKKINLSPNKRMSSVRRALDLTVPNSPLRGASVTETCHTPKVLTEDKAVVSPTVNLPNFVVDGRSPCRLLSGQKRKQSNWLADMQRVKSSGSVEKKATRQNSKGKEVRQASLQKFFAKM